MQIVVLTAPARAKRVAWGDVFLGVEPNGTVLAPAIAVPELITAGCALQANPSAADQAAASTPLSTALVAADESELHAYLRSREITTVTRQGGVPVAMSVDDMRTRAQAIAMQEAAINRQS